MNKILTQAFESAETLPEEDQKRVAAMVQELVNQQVPVDWMTPEQKAELQRRLDDPNPKYATEAEIEAVFNKYS